MQKELYREDLQSFRYGPIDLLNNEVDVYKLPYAYNICFGLIEDHL